MDERRLFEPPVVVVNIYATRDNSRWWTLKVHARQEGVSWDRSQIDLYELLDSAEMLDAITCSLARRLGL